MSDKTLFAEQDVAAIRGIVQRYEDPASALMPVLRFIQRTRGHLGEAELVFAADLLDVPHVRAYEVATYYTMFSLAPRGRHLVQVCRNLPCAMAGAEALIDLLRRELGIGPGQTTPDGAFTVVEVECIGACDRAPALMVDEDLHCVVTPESLPGILASYRAR